MIKEIYLRNGFVWFDGMSREEARGYYMRLLSGEAFIPGVNVKDADKVIDRLMEIERQNVIVSNDSSTSVSDLEERIKYLELEIAADNQIMGEWARVLDAILLCRAHGSRCVPHALNWIEIAIREMSSPCKAV